VATSPWELPEVDLHKAIEIARPDLENFSGGRVLVTGGSGFLGSWIVATLLSAIEEFRLDIKVVLVSRDPSNVPLARWTSLSVARGDVCTIDMSGTFDLVLHGAASSGSLFGVGDGEPRKMVATIVDGTRRMLEIAQRSRSRFLFLSSGAVYGPQTAPVGEECLLAPDPLDPRSAYGEAKRLAENLCASASAAGDVDAVIARLFAFVGPRIALNSQLAAGNFIEDALAGRPIRVAGDGRPLRSYLYCGDLPEWIWAIAARGCSGKAYNVGSPDAVSILELAHLAAALAEEPSSVEVALDPGSDPAPCYVPVTDLALTELGLAPRTPLPEGLARTAAWMRAHSG
jgi:nucleoside-diphosphate-sugar epimerase